MLNMRSENCNGKISFLRCRLQKVRAKINDRETFAASLGMGALRTF